MAKQKRETDVPDSVIIEAAKTSKNASEAVMKTGLTFNAYKYRAMKLGVYVTSMKGAGREVPLEEILDGKHPHYQTFKLRNRLIRDGLKKNECETPECKVNGYWLNSHIQCHLDHVDGNRFNHKIENLRMLCPNCHSQTDTFSGKKKV
jgi:hypothetical protein